MGNTSNPHNGDEFHSAASLPKYIFNTATGPKGYSHVTQTGSLSTKGTLIAPHSNPTVPNNAPTNVLPQGGRSECVCCANDQRCTLKFPCGHLYCRSCIATLFNNSLKDRSLIPVRCCNINIDQSWHQLVLTREDQGAFAQALEEAQATNQMYCPNRSCAAFINLDKLHESVKLYFACPNCKLVICSACKAAHPNITCEQYQALPVEERSLDDQLFMSLAQNQRYARCGNCKHYVEKISGCNHISCRCRQFCYACNAPTVSCVCGHNQHAPGTNYRLVHGAALPRSAPAQPGSLVAAAPVAAPVSAPVSAPGAAITQQNAGGHNTTSNTARDDPPCTTHQWRKVNSTLERHRCDNCLEKKECFQNKCDTCGLCVCTTCRFRRL